MAYTVSKTKAQSKEQLELLVSAFEAGYKNFKSSQYKEAQLRNDFINPLLKIFGWDVDNENGKTQYLRDVIQEEELDVEVEGQEELMKKNPDYTLRIDGNRKVFVEAKKLAIDIIDGDKPAFQTRRYGWNANLGISILTNFEYLVFYDCRVKPTVSDKAMVARFKVFHYKDFVTAFDNLHNLLSCASVANGYLDTMFSVNTKDTVTFDSYFLDQIEKWRRKLAEEILTNNRKLNGEDINFLVQRLLNRIIFLRICEDRNIEKFETLKKIQTYDQLKALFKQSDEKYNSGLFDFIEDNFSMNIVVDSSLLLEIFSQLYYPESPYDFAVVDPSILSQIYERYLGSKITITAKNQAEIIEEPEVTVSNGVVPTPKLVVDKIVKETLDTLCVGKDILQIRQLKIADISCGSGTFLLSVYDYLLETITLELVKKGVSDGDILYTSTSGAAYLSLKEKIKILNDNIYGVDINPYAVEVSKFSLFLKLLENETAASLDSYMKKYNLKVLPELGENIKCGNSLVDEKYYKFDKNALQDSGILYKVRPFEWKAEFPFLKQKSGFDAIVGNPPYVRIQKLKQFFKEEISYYQSKESGYVVASKETFDKYYLFIQRAIELIHEGGIVGYIVPNKFLIVTGGKSLRKFLSDSASLNKIIHFGITQLFPGRSTYTAMLIIDKQQRTHFGFKRVNQILPDFVTTPIQFETYENSKFKEDPWVFVSQESQTVFEKLNAGLVEPLEDLADIVVGLQTSADSIYIFKPTDETATTFKFIRDDIAYEVEKTICKPCLLDVPFELFGTITANAQIIFPYTLTQMNGKTGSKIIDETTFQRDFPLAWQYLNLFKDQLSKRNLGESIKHPKWYQFGRSQSITRFHSGDKLIWPVLSTGAKYIQDKNNIQFTGGGNGPYYGLISSSSYSNLYFLGILIHPIFEALIKAGASVFRGDYYSHGKQFLKNLPIRKINFQDPASKRQHDEIQSLVEQLIQAQYVYDHENKKDKKQVELRRAGQLRKQLTEAVNALYGLSEADMQTVLNDGMFETDLNE